MNLYCWCFGNRTEKKKYDSWLDLLCMSFYSLLDFRWGSRKTDSSTRDLKSHRISDTACGCSLGLSSHSAGRSAAGVRRLFLRLTPISEAPMLPKSYTRYTEKSGARVLSHVVFARFQFICATPSGRQPRVQSRCQFCLDSCRLCLLGSEPRVSKHESNPRRGKLLICCLVNLMMHLWCGNIKLWWRKKSHAGL